MKVTMENAEEFITICTAYADTLPPDGMDDHTMQLVADIYRLAELAAAQHERLVYVKERLQMMDGDNQ